MEYFEMLSTLLATSNKGIFPVLQEFVSKGNELIVILCQILAMFVIGIGMFKALMVFIKDAVLGGKAGGAIQESRLELGHSFSLGLGFLIGASILKTTVTPDWNDIGQLASIIVIRTILNHFLLSDIAKSNQSNGEERPKVPRSSKSHSKDEATDPFINDVKPASSISAE